MDGAKHRSTALRYLLSLATVCVLLAFASVQAWAVAWQEARLTNVDSAKTFLAMDGTRIVWADDRNHSDGVYDLYCYDLATQTESPLFAHPATQIKPEISGDRVVFEDYRDKTSSSDPNTNVYMYEFSSGAVTQITSDPASQYTPSIQSDRIFWHDGRNGGLDIYGYDLSTSAEFPVSTLPGAFKLYARSSGDIVVWQDDRNGGYDVYGYDLAAGQEFPVTTAFASQIVPVISGNLVVWQDSRNFASTGIDILGLDLATGTEFPVCTDPGQQFDPDIFGHLVVWEDRRNDDGDIYGFDLQTGQGFPIVVAPGAQSAPRISGRFVAFFDKRNGQTDVYCAAPLRVTELSIDEDTSELVVTWGSLPGLSYVLQVGSTPGALLDATPSIASTGLTTTARLPLAPEASAVFCRVRTVDESALLQGTPEAIGSAVDSPEDGWSGRSGRQGPGRRKRPRELARELARGGI